MRSIILLILLGSSIALADVPKAVGECKSIADPLVRLKCYDYRESTSQITFRKVVSEILESPAAIAAITAALLALISGITGPVVQLRIGKKQVESAGNREVARMRLTWMDKLRDVLSDYHSILMSADDSNLSGHAQKLSQLGTQIDLLLNRDDRIQRNLWEVADNIFNAKTREERQSYDEALIQAGRAVFKAEWEKIKAEMRGQPFQTGE